MAAEAFPVDVSLGVLKKEIVEKLDEVTLGIAEDDLRAEFLCNMLGTMESVHSEYVKETGESKKGSRDKKKVDADGHRAQVPRSKNSGSRGNGRDWKQDPLMVKPTADEKKVQGIRADQLSSGWAGVSEARNRKGWQVGQARLRGDGTSVILGYCTWDDEEVRAQHVVVVLGCDRAHVSSTLPMLASCCWCYPRDAGVSLAV